MDIHVFCPNCFLLEHAVCVRFFNFCPSNDWGPDVCMSTEHFSILHLFAVICAHSAHASTRSKKEDNLGKTGTNSKN